MNKWEDSFKCHCSDNQGLFIPNRQLSALVALILLLAFSIFMTGYFLGKRKVVEQFTQEMQQDAVADKIYTTILSKHEDQPAVDTLLVTQVEDTIVVAEATTDIVEDTQDQKKYYAQLIGFGTEKAAQTFIKKLSAKGIETELKKRVSKTAKGNTSYWYQVVTAQYSHKDDLLHLVDKLTKEENIKDARICMC
jgi:hypothetical protein